MSDKTFKKIRKRNGRLNKFNPSKISRAIAAAGKISGEFDEKIADKLSARVVKAAIDILGYKTVPTVEQIQDIVEEVLLRSSYHKTAKEYILYRDQRVRVRDITSTFNIELINKYLKQLDWQVKENSNMGFSLQGLNNYVSSELSKVYWLNEIYPKEIRDAHTKGDFHIHDLSAISVYCVGWDLWDLLVEGFTGVPEKTESKPAKHFRTVLGQVVNFFYTLQGEAAGAQAFSNLDTLLSPFIRYDKLSYDEVKQAMQEFIFNINVPTRVGFQCFDESTEILTPYGWKKHSEVSVGDNIYTFNMDRQCIESLPVKSMFSRDYEGKMFNIKNRITDQLISPEHRVVRRKFNSNEYTLEKIDDILKLKSPFIVPVGSLGMVSSETWLCDEHVELAAWVISEGTFDKGIRGSGRISIYQSKLANPKKYEKIKGICKNLNLDYTERVQFGLGRPCQVLRFTAESTRSILEIVEGNIKSIPKSILNSNSEVAKMFIETYIEGDGTEGCKITTTSELIKDQLQHLCVLAGYGSTVRKIYPEGISKKVQYLIRIIRHVDTYVSDVKEVHYKGVIWCPTTNNKTVVARRNGKVFISGNSPFTNVTLDLTPSPVYKDQNVIIGGKPMEDKYGDFQKEMDMFNRAFFEVMLEGDARGRVFTFPIPTYNITKDFDWDNPNVKLLWDITARYGIPYFSNFINSDMKPEDSRSMCCRLRLSTKDLLTRGGGLFGANPLTGSIGVVTLNMPKLAFNSSNGWDFMRNLKKVMDLAKESLEIKRKVLEEFTEKDLYPYTRFYLRSVKKRFHKYWTNHFSTIGLVGMNEACLNLLGEDITSKRGMKFAEKVLDFMRKRLIKYQKETGNNYNLEATPAEGTSYRLALKDKEIDSTMICANEESYKSGADPYYTNCVSDDTECLTYAGWKKSDEVVVGDIILTLNTNSKKLEYQPILFLNEQYIKNGEMYEIKNKRQDQLVTPNHRIVFDASRKNKFCFATPVNLPFSCVIPMAGKYGGEGSIPEDKVRLIGWVVTEGHFEKDNNAIRITQAEWANKDKFDEINLLLDSMGFKYSILGDKRGRSIFRISASDGEKIRKYITNKRVPSWCFDMSQDLLNILVDTMMKGDGTTSKNSSIFYTSDKGLADDFQRLCILTNRRAIISNYLESSGSYHIVPSKHSHVEILPKHVKRVRYTGRVWCPTTQNGTWVARRNDKPFITGNSTQLPVGYTDDIFKALDMQDKLQVKYTGGTVMHLFVGEKIEDPEVVKKLVKMICNKYRLPYFTITPTFSVCPRHGYLSGEHKFCPKCDEEIIKELDSKKQEETK